MNKKQPFPLACRFTFEWHCAEDLDDIKSDGEKISEWANKMQEHQETIFKQIEDKNAYDSSTLLDS